MPNGTELNWFTFVKLALLFISFAGGEKTVPLINKLKSFLKWDGLRAKFLAITVSVVLGASAQIVAGVIHPEPVSVEYVAALVFLLYFASQKEYERIKNLLKKE